MTCSEEAESELYIYNYVYSLKVYHICERCLTQVGIVVNHKRSKNSCEVLTRMRQVNKHINLYVNVAQTGVKSLWGTIFSWNKYIFEV